MQPPEQARTAAEFYAGAPDHRGRRLDEILAWGDPRLEGEHDYIQWLFPLREPSPVNPLAPTFTDTDAVAFQEDPGLRRRMLSALERMLRFYGLQPTGAGKDPRVERAGDFQARAANWLTPHNHNFLRLTRMLKSLRLAGLHAESLALLDCLDGIYREWPEVVGARTWEFWAGTAREG